MGRQDGLFMAATFERLIHYVNTEGKEQWGCREGVTEEVDLQETTENKADIND